MSLPLSSASLWQHLSKSQKDALKKQKQNKQRMRKSRSKKCFNVIFPLNTIRLIPDKKSIVADLSWQNHPYNI